MSWIYSSQVFKEVVKLIFTYESVIVRICGGFTFWCFLFRFGILCEFFYIFIGLFERDSSIFSLVMLVEGFLYFLPNLFVTIRFLCFLFILRFLSQIALFLWFFVNLFIHIGLFLLYLLNLLLLLFFDLWWYLFLDWFPGNKPKTYNFWLFLTPTATIAPNNLFTLFKGNLTICSILLFSIELNFCVIVSLKGDILYTCWIWSVSDSDSCNGLSSWHFERAFKLLTWFCTKLWSLWTVTEM